MHDSKVRGTVGLIVSNPRYGERGAMARDMTPDDHAVLERYSGWGGLSIERVKSTLPPDLVPETFGLIHEYYTPSAGQAEQGE